MRKDVFAPLSVSRQLLLGFFLDGLTGGAGLAYLHGEVALDRFP
jgi:hypothetical protein